MGVDEIWDNGKLVNCSVRLFIQEQSELNDHSRTLASRQAGIPIAKRIGSELVCGLRSVC